MEYKILNHKVILTDYEFGSGSIDIIGLYNYNYRWNSMSDNIKDFILKINYDYFYRTLRFNTKGNFNAKHTTSNIRKYIKDEFKYELPYYKHMEFQKDMREKLKKLESIESDILYYDELYCFYDKLDYYLVGKNDRDEIQSVFESICRCEPQHHFCYDESDENKFLFKIYKRLIKQLKK